MTIEFLSKLDEYIPLILQFYIPGFIFLRLISIGKNENRDDGKYVIEIVISYIFVFMINIALKAYNPFMFFEPLTICVIASVLAALVAILLFVVGKRFHSFRKSFYSILGFSNENVLADHVNLHTGSFVRVTYYDLASEKSFIIIGRLDTFDTGVEPKYLSINDYTFESGGIINDKKYKHIIIPIASLLFLEVTPPDKKSPS